MSLSTQHSRRLRWAVPAGAVTVVAGVFAASFISAAQATPPLPSRTPAQLLAALAGRTGPLPPLTGTVVETASLGLPDLPAMGDPTSPQSLATGSHTVRVWYADPQHIRLAIPGQLSETDVIRSGQDAWIWSSVRNTATHYKLPPPGGAAAAPVPTIAPLTPQQAAAQILAAVGPTTDVTVASNVMVAGEPCYELVLAPKDSRSLIGEVRIAIDGTRYVPLRVEVMARGESTPAFETGFTSISFTQPAAANFAFGPPAGATVIQGNVPALHAVAPAVPLSPVPGAVAPGAVTRTPGAVTRAPRAQGPASTVIGQGWLAVAVFARPAALPSTGASGVTVFGPPAAFRVWPGKQVTCGPSAKVRVPPSAGLLCFRQGVPVKVLLPGRIPAGRMPGRPGTAVVAGPPGSVGGPPGPDLAVFGALYAAATPVHGSWGSGRLLRTKLLSVLITDDGRLLIGAVTPQLLYAATAKTTGLASQAGR